MKEEKIRILDMIESGKVTAAEGLELLKSLEQSDADEETSYNNNASKILRIRVSGDKVKKINMNFPLNLIRSASKFMGLGLSFIPQEILAQLEDKGVNLKQIDLEEVAEIIDQGLMVDKLVDIDVDDAERGSIKVEIYVD